MEGKSQVNNQKSRFLKEVLKTGVTLHQLFCVLSEGHFWKEVMPTETNLQLNSCQAKDKPPRPLRSERSRKADGTASSRIACQESTLWQCRQQIQFDVTLLSFHKPLVMRPQSVKRSEGNYITYRSFGVNKRDKINCPTKPEKSIKENIAQKLKLVFV